MEYLADSKSKKPLHKHLADVAELAARFGAAFQSETWGRLLGEWHDLGKYRGVFQKYMLGEDVGGSSTEHAVVGARHASEVFAESGKLALQYCIACHHTGLQDKADLAARLQSAGPLLREARENAPPELLTRRLPPLPAWLTPPSTRDREQRDRWCLSLEFWIRMLHSCLVDADRLDAETRDPDWRPRPDFPPVPELRDRLDDHVNAKTAEARDHGMTPVNAQRKVVLDACRQAATWAPGFFSLTVPTGGGKTLASMSFALNHAWLHSMERVIVVIPYTSIIEQNAREYAEALGNDNVIQHHSGLDPETETKRNQLASENWDAPVVVTTNVQFLETLFAGRNTRLRKLHNIARSVVIFDEAQAMPPEYLIPVLDALRELRENYGCSLLLCTATQPALNRREALPAGLDGVREIIPDDVSLSRKLSRVQVEWPPLDAPAVTYEELAERIAAERMERVLVVTHLREDARRMAKLLPEPGVFHLSALMCGAHRQQTLGLVRDRLQKTKEPVRLVSTQLIEAGVDVDFPVVFRALAGMDSIAQAAGRCNREGKLAAGRVIVFRAPTDPPRGVLCHGLAITRSMLKLASLLPRTEDGQIQFTHPNVFRKYFELFYAQEDKDAKGIQALRQDFKYRQTEEGFELIEDGWSVPVIVPFGDASLRVDALRRKFRPHTRDFRALQPYTVLISKRTFGQLAERGAWEPIHDTVHWLTQPWHRLYDQRFGLVLDEGNLYPDPAGYIG